MKWNFISMTMTWSTSCCCCCRLCLLAAFLLLFFYLVHNLFSSLSIIIIIAIWKKWQIHSALNWLQAGMLSSLWQPNNTRAEYKFWMWRNDSMRVYKELETIEKKKQTSLRNKFLSPAERGFFVKGKNLCCTNSGELIIRGLCDASSFLRRNFDYATSCLLIPITI